MGARVLPHMCGEIVKTGIVDMLLEMDIHGIMPGGGDSFGERGLPDPGRRMYRMRDMCGGMPSWCAV